MFGAQVVDGDGVAGGVFGVGGSDVVADTGTFVPLDQPQRLAELLEGFVREPVLAS